MVEYPFERAAMRGDPMPQGLNGAEQVLYQGLVLLYARYHVGALDRAAAQREKVRLSRSYDGLVSLCKLWEHTAELWQRLEGPMARFRQRPSVETAKEAMELLYGVQIQWEGETS